MLVIQWQVGSGVVCSVKDLDDSTLSALFIAEEKSNLNLLVK